METEVDTPAQASAPAAPDPEAPGSPVAAPLEPAPPVWGWRRWVLRVFIVALLLAGAATVALAAFTIIDESGKDGRGGRTAVYGVLMPNDTEFRKVTSDLLDRKQPEKLRGITVVGAGGKVTVLRDQAGQPSFLSAYLNPNALQVIARAIGVSSDDTITVDELRLEVLKRTGRQRWRLRGTKSGAPWRATIAPNGTNLRLIPTKDA